MPSVYAHSLENKPTQQWQLLEEHLSAVSAKAAEFASTFNSSSWAALIGALHDIGKARESFQNYLYRCNGLEDLTSDSSLEHSHSGVGAIWTINAFPRAKLGRILAYCIAGHHAGLPDWIGGETPNGALSARIEKEADLMRETAVAEWVSRHQELWRSIALAPPWRFGNTNKSDISFWIRMLFSCLVDADFLDTEAFMNRTQAMARSQYPAIGSLARSFFSQMDALEGAAPRTPLNGIRTEIRQVCETSASLPTGLFSLTVPTGGGKTLSSTAFALRHALKHNLRRIIYVIPYTSIIEQTADVLRKFLGADNVIEHHSNFDSEKQTKEAKLAAENWDAPIIVTTSVQFFESLYATRPSRCRKLHNITKSVVILDEVQLLPPHLLLPCQEAIRQLAANYGVSVVLSTATQPSLSMLQDAREIIPDSMRLFERLKRTEYVWPADRRQRLSWEELSEELSALPQVLCIVNTRRDCRDLHALMPAGTIHLSASMCGEHRSRVIASIKDKLKSGDTIRVISTQLVEAGVDIDFPVVYRAYTGLASIAQAAGRCNREGSNPNHGRVVVFMPPKAAPIGTLRKAEDALSGMLAEGVDAHSSEAYKTFFDLYYSTQNDLGTQFASWLVADAYELQFQFREAARAFQLIDDRASASIIVRYNNNDDLIKTFEKIGPKRDIMRKLQRYAISVPRASLRDLLVKGLILEPHPGIYLQTVPSLYTEALGLDIFHGELASEDLFI